VEPDDTGRRPPLHGVGKQRSVRQVRWIDLAPMSCAGVLHLELDLVISHRAPTSEGFVSAIGASRVAYLTERV
jgi:hypothetical protein